jgi:hypothetical protein
MTRAGSRVGMHVRVALTSLLFEKALALGPNAFVKTTTGQIVNLIGGDVFR